MTKKDIPFTIEVYATDSELTAADAFLLNAAREATKNAYAPYSSFYVGAAAMLQNGQLVTGTNQENASYPVTICAERTLLSAVAVQYPGQPVMSMAISYHNGKGTSKQPISPCGICRQTLVEYEERTQTPIRLILGGAEGEVFIIKSARLLLPLSFTATDLLQ
ncbi:MAG: hypothetical protein RL172_2352 [Bacteroidota bacterium]|jgi:cytidine deaminase